MTGPEHYREAERLLVEAGDLQVDVEDANVEPLLRRAQVHATLAGAAASVILGVGINGSNTVNREEWFEAIRR